MSQPTALADSDLDLLVVEHTPQLAPEAKVASWWHHFQPLQTLSLPLTGRWWWCNHERLRRMTAQSGRGIMSISGRSWCLPPSFNCASPAPMATELQPLSYCGRTSSPVDGLAFQGQLWGEWERKPAQGAWQCVGS